ncbi:MAG: tRNA preQ1(34) S-adenosylmethionine ribosyltransferase-isomerase QueA [Desulfobulbaceae bacterium]|nr:tRNA preQ1(34) S-adenosylmethionine ribosyltransferase-isomerase QueA [Desulfobulbaceae bacterium]
MIDPIYQLSSYDYHLPESQIAQEPTTRRDGSRLLVAPNDTVPIDDCHFSALADLIKPGDILVVNDTRVFPARILGKKETGGHVELLLLHYPDTTSDPCNTPPAGSDHLAGHHDAPPPQSSERQTEVRGLIKSSKRPKPGGRLFFAHGLCAEILELLDNGEARVLLRWQGNLEDVLNKCGMLPLPPYIHRSSQDEHNDRQRYQTIYAKETGAIAAPTAGLHFSDELIRQIKGKGCTFASVTLHVGYGTFAPVRVADIRDHVIHAEHVTVPKSTVDAIHAAKAAGGKIWAVGTTSARALEFAAASGELHAVSDWCRLYIYPGYQFKIVDNLITNFHLPKSSLLFMVSAFAGIPLIQKVYQQALDLGYRFYSYGDAMLLYRK